jgi:putative transcriptional regulator
MMFDVVPSNLTGKMLIAMPGMADSRFAGSVVFLCAHSEDGAV